MNQAEHIRIKDAKWRAFGPYLSERQWGTVREDYSPDGSAWDYFPHDHARSRAYRWGEDGLGGFCDEQQLLCLSLGLWNSNDPILKERLFGLTGPEGNHGEDVKELYYYLDGLPSHAYMQMLYKYPQGEFPYSQIVHENRSRSKAEPEFELVDTGAFDEGRYFDVFIEYAKAAPEDILMRVRVCNRGPESAPITVIPQAVFRNTWSWGRNPDRPEMHALSDSVVALTHPSLGNFELHCDAPDRLAFCENESNVSLLYGAAHDGYSKDGLHELIVHGVEGAIHPDKAGTKCGAIWSRMVPTGAEVEIRLRLTRPGGPPPFRDFDGVFMHRKQEADEFYEGVHGLLKDGDARSVQRQALAGMLWSKQFYYFDVNQWLEGDPGQPAPPPRAEAGSQ